jgi:hypothetical protein
VCGVGLEILLTNEAGLEGMNPSCKPSGSAPCNVLMLVLAAIVDSRAGSHTSTCSHGGEGASDEAFKSLAGS